MNGKATCMEVKMTFISTLLPYKFLIPYSPYFMAIECMFAEWKTHTVLKED